MGGRHDAYDTNLVCEHVEGHVPIIHRRSLNICFCAKAYRTDPWQNHLIGALVLFLGPGTMSGFLKVPVLDQTIVYCVHINVL
jgi:hypothetical protein